MYQYLSTLSLSTYIYIPIGSVCMPYIYHTFTINKNPIVSINLPWTYGSVMGYPHDDPPIAWIHSSAATPTRRPDRSSDPTPSATAPAAHNAPGGADGHGKPMGNPWETQEITGINGRNPWETQEISGECGKPWETQHGNPIVDGYKWI